MSDLTDSQQRQMDFLLADFAAIKAEINRRSTLQRVVLFGYVALWAFVIQQSRYFPVPGLWIVTIWVAAALGFQFYARERLEISRLGEVIRTRIALVASSILGVPAADLVPSQTKGNSALDRSRSQRRAYNRTFMWTVFFTVPILTTLWYAVEHSGMVHQLWAFDTPTPWAAMVVILSAGYTLILLRRHA